MSIDYINPFAHLDAERYRKESQVDEAELRKAYEVKYELKRRRDIPSDEIHELSLNDFIVHRALEMHRRGDATYTEALEAAVLALAAGNRGLIEEIKRIQRPRAIFIPSKPI